MTEHSLLVDDYLQTLESDSPVRFSSEQQLSLFALFGDVLYRALDVIDRCPITLYKYQEQGIFVIKARKDQYYILPAANLCSCPAFKYKVLQSDAEATCKHVLACRLARILRRHTEVNSSEEYFLSLYGELLPVST